MACALTLSSVCVSVSVCLCVCVCECVFKCVRERAFIMACHLQNHLNAPPTLLPRGGGVTESELSGSQSDHEYTLLLPCVCVCVYVCVCVCGAHACVWL